MGETLVGFLSHLRNSYLKDFSRNSRLRIVCGNESADLDSVVSAITYAYFSYINDPSKPIVPILNILKADLELRRDIVWVLKQRNIPHSLLFFQEDLQDLRKRFNCPIDAVLVDHNDTQSVAKTLVDSVVGIIDHHEDLGLHKDILDRKCGPRVVTVAGSCSSLVFNYWHNILGSHRRKAEIDALYLCLGALLIDTTNMSYKVERPDLQAHATYKVSLHGFDFDGYFDQVRQAKDDIEGLPLRDILRKDYKEFEFPKAREGNVKCGMASVVRPLEWIQQQFGDQELINACGQFLQERSQDILLILTSWTTEEGKFSRQLAFCTGAQQNIEISQQIAEKVHNFLDLKPIDIMDSPVKSFVFFAQLNTNASRKQVAPCLQDACREL
ncbi:LANO_0B00738g1_1 [Lachancea nothofagi CBS 11611]|uniref:LANO_0B00738g1_1 n=1 Tax=Lachancea nothofagi CBS 11611 TaxID=1266666 RepID=A0A1G4IUP2_9SACH|nr:LANO_0B00738g1_1 [Lachancea nothofagi CBS 11611]